MGMAEAMALGKPVIGTGFSGNNDFLTTYTGFPVAFSMQPLKVGEYPFSEGQYWAEPDLQDAIKQLRYIANYPADRLRRASAGSEFVRSLYSDERLASAIKHRLDEIRIDLSTFRTGGVAGATLGEQVGGPAVSLHQKDSILPTVSSLFPTESRADEGRDRLHLLDLENARLMGENVLLTGDNARLTGEGDRLHSENDRLAREIARLKGERDRLHSENAWLADQNARAQDKIDEIQQNLKSAVVSVSERWVTLRSDPAILSKARGLQGRRGLLRLLKRLARLDSKRKHVELSAITESGLFDPGYYLDVYPDVKAAGVDPAIHYFNVGDTEGRNPGPAFSTTQYKNMNPDVAAQGVTALGHYELFGRREKRPLPFPEKRVRCLPSPVSSASLPEGALAKPPLLADGRREWLSYESIARRIAEERAYQVFKAQPATVQTISAPAVDLETFAAALEFPCEDQPKVSIIVPVFNNLKLTLECLHSIHAYTDSRTPFEVIVSDDASTDASELVLSRIPNLMYVRNETNLGFLMNCNHAVRVARGDFIVFLNNDTQVTRNWLVALTDVFAKSAKIAASGPKILYPNGRLQEAGVLISSDCSARLIGLNDDPALPRYNFARRVDYCSGACLIVRRDLFTELGGFSERLRPAYCEDLDLGLRLRERGFETWYAPDATVLHHLSKTHDILGDSYKMQRIVSNTQKIAEQWQGAVDELNRVRLFAFYLPQYHPIPENNRWWGRGFTEWTNVTRGMPQYGAHWQPRLPADLGFYDLRVPEVLKEQADLARRYGVEGFCFYYYWLGGKRLLESPLATMLASGKPEFPFLLCWANENWTRRWDGVGTEILISQSHSDEDDEAVIRDLIRYFRDPRYVRINGRPVLLIYRVGLFPDFSRTAAHWRTTCFEEGIGEIYLAMVASFDEGGKPLSPRSIGCDAAVQFPPHGAAVPASPPADLRPDFSGYIWDYEESVLSFLRQSLPAAPYFPGVMPSWDNTARRMSSASIFKGATPGAFQAWLEEAIRRTCEHNFGDERIVFINAWNEWAEGAHLEPDRMFGHANLEAVRNALLAHTLRP